MQSAKQDNLNASYISQYKTRPVSPFAANSPFSLTKAGFANPGNLDRQGNSAMRAKRNLNAGTYNKLATQDASGIQQLTQKVVVNENDVGRNNLPYNSQ